MPLVPGNVNVADVQKVLERAAQHILDAAGSDPVTSRADIEKKLESLDGEERALVDMFYRFSDHRDHKPGARITESDISKTLEYAKRKLVERLDKDGDHELSNVEIGRMSRIGKLAVAIAQSAGGTAPTGGTQSGGPIQWSQDVQDAIAEKLVELKIDGNKLLGVKVTSDWDSDSITPLFKSILETAGGEHLENLNLGHINQWDSGDTYADALKEIARHGPFPNLQEIFVADASWDETEISWIDVGDISDAFALSDTFSGLHVKGSNASFSAVEHNGLKSIFFESGGLPGGVLRSIAASTFENVDSLELWLGTEDYGATSTISDVNALLASDGLPDLKSLGLKNSDLSNDIAKAIVDAPMLAQLGELDLGMGTLTDEGAQALLDNKDKLMHLKVIDLDDNFLSPDMRTKLTDAFGAKVNIGDQGKWDDLQYDPDWLYVSVGE